MKNIALTAAILACIAGLALSACVAPGGNQPVNSFVKTKTVPLGYLELAVSPGNVTAYVGENVEIRCAVESLINTPVEIMAIDLVLFDSHESLIRKQPMEVNHWSARVTYTIVGDEAYYRLEVNFTTPYAEPREHSEYSADYFPIVVTQKGG